MRIRSQRPQQRSRFLRILVVLLGPTGCAAHSTAPILTGQNRDCPPEGSVVASLHRLPDAVVLEPPPALPIPAEHADARGVIALREPLGGDAVRDLILALVGAWQQESLEQLIMLLTRDAGPIEARTRGRTALVEAWRLRLHTHPYRRLADVELVRPERIERYGWKDLSLAESPARPADMGAEELFVRVPIEVTRAAGERLFGDVMLVLLRREDGKYKIAAYGETGS